MRTRVILNTFHMVSGLKSLRKRAQSIPYKILHRYDNPIFSPTFIFQWKKLGLKKKHEIFGNIFGFWVEIRLFQRENEISLCK